MDAVTTWDIIKNIISWAWIPIMWYMNMKHTNEQKSETKQELIEQRLVVVEQQSKINSMQIEALHRIQIETKEDIKEVKHGIEKLVDRLLK